MNRLMRAAVLSIFAVILMCVLLVSAPLTEVGSRLLIRCAALIVSVDIDGVKGSFADELLISRVHMNTPNMEIEIREFSAKLQPSCLLRWRVCFEELAVGYLELQWPDGLWRNGPARATISMDRNRATIHSFYATDTFLKLTAAPANGNSGVDDSELLQTILLPMAVVVEELELDGSRWDLFGQAYHHQSVALRGSWVGSQLAIDEAVVEDERLGQLQFSGEALFAADWPFSVVVEAQSANDLNWQELLGLPPAIGDISLLSPFKLSVGGTRFEQEFSLEATFQGLIYSALELSLSGRYRNVSGAPSQLELKVIELRDIGSHSALSATGKLVLGETKRWELQLKSSGFAVPAINEYPAGRLVGELGGLGSFAEGHWNIALDSINVSGDVGDMPAQISGRFAMDNRYNLSGSRLFVNINGAEIRLEPTPFKMKGVDVDVKVADIARWVPDAKGRLTLAATLSEDYRNATVEGRLDAFRWGEVHFDQTKLRGHFGLEGEREFTFKLDVLDLEVDRVNVSNVNLEMAGNLQVQTFSVHSKGDVNVALEGESQYDGDDKAKIALQGTLGLLAGYLPKDYDLTGVLDLQLDTQWQGGSGLILAGDAHLRNGVLKRQLEANEYARIVWDDAALNFTRDNEGLVLHAGWENDGNLLLVADISLPEDKRQKLSGLVSFEALDLQIFEPFILELATIQGKINGQVALSGTAEHPLTYGDLELTEGRFELVSNPTEFDKLHLNMKLSGDKVALAGGMRVGGGELELSGTLMYKPELLLQLELAGQQQVLLFPPSTRVKLSQNISVIAGLDYVSVAGDITVHEGLLKHEELPEGGVALSEDVFFVDPVAYSVKSQRTFDVAMDLQIKIEDQFRVLGDVVDVTVGGDLHLLQDRGRPLQLFGNLNVVGGELRAYGQSLQVRRGTVAFSGTPENPALDMRAERSISRDNVTVGVTLNGSLVAPVLDIYSDPVMPRTESLSYLMRGRGLDSGAGADGAALALSMGASMVNKTGVLQSLDKVPGINNIELGAQGSEEDTAATISGYIGNRIYLSYGVGLYEPINILTARLYLQTRLWVEVVSGLENSLDLYYSFDIE